MRIAMISEHASPLAALGGVDAGGQNAHVAELSAASGPFDWVLAHLTFEAPVRPDARPDGGR